MKNYIFSLFLGGLLMLGFSTPAQAHETRHRHRPQIEQTSVFEIKTIFCTAVAPQEMRAAEMQTVQKIANFLVSSADANRHFLSIKAISLNYAVAQNLSDTSKQEISAEKGFNIFESNASLCYGNNYLSRGYAVAR